MSGADRTRIWRVPIRTALAAALASSMMLTAGCTTMHRAAKDTVFTLKGAAPGGGDLDYLVRHPRGQAEGMPAIIFLHGSGERGGPAERVLVHGPWSAQDLSDTPFVIAAPHLPEGAVWTADAVMAVAADIEKRFSIDSSRIYLTGLSLGGHGTWQTGVAYPDRFAALVPVSGRGDPSLSCALADTPIWGFHGVDDQIVLASDQQLMIDAVRECGGRPGFTLYPDVGHDAWTTTYSDPRLYDWLLTYRR